MEKLIILDCDGVIIDSEVLSCSIEVDILASLGFEISLSEYMDLYMGQSGQCVIDDIKKKAPMIDVSKMHEMSVSKTFSAEFAEKLKAIPGIENFIKNIKYPFCIASGSSLKRLDYTLGIVGLLPYFEGKIFSAELVENPKPAPDVFLYAARKMGYEPKDCIVIEDSINGIKAGIAAGMTTFAFSGGSHMNENRINTLNDLGAKNSFSSMDELLNHLNQL